MADHNIIRAPATPPRPYKEFPSMRWHPETGEATIFHSADEVPEGFLEHHPNHDFGNEKPAPVKTKTTELTLSRDEIKDAIKAGNIPFQGNAGTAALYAVLLESVKKALDEAKIEYDPASTDAKALLALFPKE